MQLPALLRVRTSSGQTTRVPIDVDQYRPDEPFYESALCSKFGPGTWSRDPSGTTPIPQQTLLGELRTGEMLFFKPTLSLSPSSLASTSLLSLSQPSISISAIDRQLETQEGRIVRKRDPFLCRHSQNGMCPHCAPLDPFDAGYHMEHGIKFLSFWSFIKKERETLASILPSLEISFGQCKSGIHLPYPQGMCTACQPSPITLQQQKFRMVDHVEFVDSATVDRFIDRWRVTSHQALAWLIGTYDFYAGVPLGVKGKVRYLWMPLQETAQDGIELPTDTSPLYGALETLLHNTLAWLGLEKIGAIWTDLSPAGVPPCRGPETYFVSSWEIAWITQMQLAHPIPGCFEASSASRWISIVVTADVNGEVALFPYQVSLQATSLAKAELLHPTSEASSCAIWAPKNGHFSSVPLPELFYRVEEVQDTEEGNARANPAQRRADPCFPSEYLLVSLTHGFLADKMQPCNHFDIAATFVAAAGEICSSTFLCALAPFLLHHDSGDESMTGLMRQIHADLGKLSVFTLGLLVALHGMNIFTSEELTLLKDHSDAFFDTSGWRDLKERMKAARADAGSIDMQANDAPLWACTFCTLINPVSVDDCEACGLPRSPA